MDYLKERTFEVFRYTLPGVFLILIILLLDDRISVPYEIYKLYFKEVSTELILGLVMFGFIVGLIIDQFSGLKLRKLKKSKLTPEYISNSKLTKPQKYALIRELSPTNFQHIEIWNVYKGMCDNLSFDFILLIVISVHKTISTDEKLIWIALIIISIISVVSLIDKAQRYKQWVQQDIDSVIDMIDVICEKRKLNTNH